MNTIAAAVGATLFFVSTFAPGALAQNPLLQKAHEAFLAAQSLESELNEKPEESRSRNEVVRVINAYQRVYLITPRTGYADNALVTMARLYEEIKDSRAAIRTLNFLLREYPSTPFRNTAEADLARLQGVPERKTQVVENIRYWEAPNAIRIVVDVTGEVKFDQGEAKSPDRVFIDISPARLNSLLLGKRWNVNGSLLSQIRVGQNDGATVRVVLDVGATKTVSAFTLREPDRIVIDILGADTAVPATAAVEPAAASPSAASAAQQPLKAEVVSQPAPAVAIPRTAVAPAATPALAETKPVDSAPKAASAAKPARNGSGSLVRSLGLKLSRVVIDPGHGGQDTGSIGPTGFTEKELVLDVALQLKEMIESGLGAEVMMTRGDDSFVPLETRTSVANEQGADLFISIHANSSRTRSVRGVETFFLNLTTSRDALETASRENAASERSIHELQDLVKKIMLRDKVDESRELAKQVQRAMSARKGSGVDRGVKQAPFVVLIGASMPSVLVEIGFISNPEEERLIRTPAYRRQIAESLFEGVRSYAESLSGLKTAKTQDKN